MIDYNSGLVCCDRCGVILGNYLNDDYFRLIRLKYCPACKSQVVRDQHRTAKQARAAATRRRRKLIEEQNELLKMENLKLREMFRKNGIGGDQ